MICYLLNTSDTTQTTMAEIHLRINMSQRICVTTHILKIIDLKLKACEMGPFQFSLLFINRHDHQVTIINNINYI